MLAALAACASGAAARELTYQPQNPSFGGPVANGQYLLSTAQAQDRSKDKSLESAGGGATTMTQSQLFASQLQSQLLSSLASQVNAAIFPTNGQTSPSSGKFVFGDQTISYTRGLETINVSIFDASTGQTTNVQVPLVQVSTP